MCEALEQGIAIHAIPGVSAVLTALMLAGLPTDRFLFAGFLPAKAAERRTTLEELRMVPATLVFFESPHRIAGSLAAMQEVLGDRPAAVARELTKLYEDVCRSDLKSLADDFARREQVKGEITIVVGAPAEAAPDFRKADALLAAALAHMPLRAAAELVARALDLPKRALYERALALKNRDEDR